jgi:hypothetical protein
VLLVELNAIEVRPRELHRCVFPGGVCCLNLVDG